MIDKATQKRLASLANADRKARDRAEAVRETFFEYLVEAREGGATVRELAAATGISYQRIHELTTVRNRRTAHAQAQAPKTTSAREGADRIAAAQAARREQT